MTSDVGNLALPRLRGSVLRWAVLAPGNIAHDFTRTLHANSDQRVVAVGSRSAARAQAFGAQFGVEACYGSYEAAVADPAVEAVYVASPNSAHLELALLAIASGKPVLVEKPLAMNAMQAREIADAARAANILVMEALWTRYLPQSHFIAELIEAGAIGDVRLATAEVGWNAAHKAHDDKIFQPRLGGGAALDSGIYAVWFAHFAIGSAIDVRALGSRSASGVDEQFAAILRADATKHAAITTTMSATNSGYASIIGTAGGVEILDHFVFSSRLRVRRGDGVRQWADPSRLTGRQGLVWQAAFFADYVAQGRVESPLHSLADSIALARVLDEIRSQIA